MYDACMCTYVIICFILTSFYKPLGLLVGLYSHIHLKKKTKCIVIMSIKPSFYIKKFMTPGTRAQELEWEEYGYNVKNILDL